MTLTELWAELERRAPAERVGRVVQRIHPESELDIFATVELRNEPRGSRRALELQVDDSVVRDLQVSGTRQVALEVDRRGSGRSAIVLALEDAGARDLFAALCADVATATITHPGEGEAVEAWIGRFAKWRRMLQGAARGLSPRRQRGLHAELMTIRDDLIPAVGFDEAVLAWKGPDGAPRDFELGGLAVEVKSSAANEPQVVAVHGERQLDDAGLEALIMVHRSLEMLRDAGETLPFLVEQLRAIGEGRREVGTFEDRLLQSGYVDVHEPLYRRTGYAVRRTAFFQVRSGFPRMTEGDLVDGIGAVRYSLAIDACRDFEVERTFLLERLGEGA